jgi:hypothetical protein
MRRVSRPSHRDQGPKSGEMVSFFPLSGFQAIAVICQAVLELAGKTAAFSP